MKEMDRAHKNDELIEIIKRCSQLKIYDWIKWDNDEMSDGIKSRLSVELYARRSYLYTSRIYSRSHNSDRTMIYFYDDWVQRYIPYAKELKE